MGNCKLKVGQLKNKSIEKLNKNEAFLIFNHIHGSFAIRIGYFVGSHEILTELLRKKDI